MTTVFKFLNLCQIKSIVAYCVLTISISFKATASHCATVSFNLTKVNGELYVAFLARHNGEKLEKTTHKDAIINGNHHYYLAPGRHVLLVEQWPVKTYRKLRRNNRIRSKYNYIDMRAQKVVLTVKADRNYQLEFGANDLSSGFLKIKNENEIPCTLEEQSLLQAKLPIDMDEGTESVELSAPLEYRLRRIMTKLARYHQHREDDTYSNAYDAKLNHYMGTTIDNEYKDNGSALQILSVLPYSLANKLRLMSGDKITHLNGKEIKADDRTPDQQLSAYFGSLYLGEAIDIKVLRNGKSESLTGTYTPIIVPAANYQIIVTKKITDARGTFKQFRALSTLLQFEFDQLILEIKNHFLDNNGDQPFITIYRDEKLDNRIGIFGDRIVLREGIGVKIAKIDENSVAESLGLMVGDIILSINHHDITEKNVNHLMASLTSLKQDDEFVLRVKRKEQYLTLKNTFQPQTLAGFTLMLDLQSLEAAEAHLEKVSRMNRFKKKRPIDDQRKRRNVW